MVATCSAPAPRKLAQRKEPFESSGEEDGRNLWLGDDDDRLVDWPKPKREGKDWTEPEEEDGGGFGVGGGGEQVSTL
jgi:hypothetical protein